MTDFPSPVAAVLSDLDGVLVDSGGAIEATWSTWARSHGIDPALLVGRIHGRPSGEVIREVAPGLDVDSESDVIARMDIEGPPATLLPGAAELLGGAAGVPVAVVTSCPDELAAVRLRTAGLTAPEVLVTSDRVRAGKPDPQGYRLAAAELGVDVTRCVVFEDAPAGVAAGRAAGASVVGITTTHPGEALLAAGAATTAASVADALMMVFGAADRAE
jgi:mannitol-1-/sugar-/sorbitol-6-phosphatase